VPYHTYMMDYLGQQQQKEASDFILSEREL